MQIGAIFMIEPKLFDLPSSKNFRVSLHRKLLIMVSIPFTGKR